MDRDFYRESRVEEIETLVELGSFQVAAVKEAVGHILYRAGFVDSVRPDGTKRLRLCMAA